jgi:hypothetical protein
MVTTIGAHGATNYLKAKPISAAKAACAIRSNQSGKPNGYTVKCGETLQADHPIIIWRVLY